MRVLDLFSGIGGFSLGLERAGMKTVAFCEIDPFCRRVLAKHWPEVHCYPDVRELSAQHLTADGHGSIDLISGGFPCQDISVAGRGAGITGERSGLWSEFARLIGEIRPRYAIVENVAALLGRGLGDVLGDLAALGYDAEWHCIPASAIGAPHVRDRVWIVANTAGEGREEWYGQPCRRPETPWRLEPVGLRGKMAHPNGPRLALRDGRDLARWAQASTAGADWWAIEPDVGRVVDGPTGKVDRRKRLIGLGNSLVPQIPELIGRAIMECENHDK
ncbi:MAG TPA: DNA (cytosine-5-)-methyltransferase [Pseudolysinimonas sp.]|jgi:DNA (cytosine-5)-methyltransferase 1